MSECICGSCKNLKGIIGDDGEVTEYQCEFGFPSDRCEECDDCDEADCSETCGNFVSDEEEDKPRIVNCKACGKELQKVMDDNDEGDVYCIDCYLKLK